MADPIDAAEAIAAKLAKPNGRDPGVQLEIVPFADLLTPDLESRPLVKGVINKETVILVFGESGCGKTFFTLDLALRVAEGGGWLVLRARAGRVLEGGGSGGRSPND